MGRRKIREAKSCKIKSRSSAVKKTISKANPFPHKRAGNASTDPNRELPANDKAGFFRDKAKINLLRMYNKKPDKVAMHKRPLEPARVAPDRRWFGNTRVITQNRLEQFREAVEEARKNPYSVILKQAKLPLTLFEPDTRIAKTDLLAIESFEKTFGPKSRRKRPRNSAGDVTDLIESVEKKKRNFDDTKDDHEEVLPDAPSQAVFKKGTSRRIWQELYKVVDSSDVVVEVIDARDPNGTRCKKLEDYIKKSNKYIILLLNKCDLIPTWNINQWVKVLSSEYPTIAFHSSIKKSFGKLTLINLLRQYSNLLKHRKHVSVGFIGYPNVGKSSVINTIRKKIVCKAAPVPGETKVWQYIALTHRLYCIDCPGVVPGDIEAGDESDKLLKGVVRAEKVEDPENHIPRLLEKVAWDVLCKTYKIPEEVPEGDANAFLLYFAKKSGKLLAAGEPDISTAARMILYDWQRGTIPYYTPLASCKKSDEVADDVPPQESVEESSN